MTKPSRLPGVRREKYAQQNTITVTCDLNGLNQYLDALGDAVQEAVRPAAQAAAQVVYDDVLSRVDRIGEVTGNLRSAVYQAYAAKESTPERAVYDVSWNHLHAPHAILVEYGHIQRYVTYIGDDGHWYTAVRPGMRGKPRPKRRAPQSTKDAYYVPLAGGPKHVAARPFIRPAIAKFDQAMEAAKAEIFKRLDAIK